MKKYSRSSHLEVFLGEVLKMYRRTPMSRCEFNKLHFGTGVLYIKFPACIFSERIFLRTPLDGCFWYRLVSPYSSCIWKGVNLHAVENKWEAKYLYKKFYDILEKGWVGIEIKCHITWFREQIELRVAPKREVEKPWVGPNAGCFSSCWPLLGARKLAPKKLKNNFFPMYIIFFKGSCTLLQCFYIFRDLKTWYFNSFYLHKLTLMQSKYELTDICILYADPQLITADVMRV